MSAPAPKPLGYAKHQEHQASRKPDPYRFAGQDPDTVFAEKFADADWRDKDRSQGEEISRRIKWRKERDAQSSICHRIEHAM